MLASARLSDGMLSNTEDRLATVRRTPGLAYPHWCAAPLSVEGTQNEVFFGGIVWPPLLGPSCHSDTQYDNNFIRQSICRLRRTFRGFRYRLLSSTHCRRACPLPRRTESRAYGTIPHFPRPQRSAAPLSVEGNKGEVPCARILRPPRSLHLVAAIHEYGAANALRTTTSYDKAFAARAKLVGEVGMGYFRAHNRWMVCYPARKKASRTHGAMPPLPRPSRSAAPPLWVVRIQNGVPSFGIPQAPCPDHPVTLIRDYGSANALRTTASSDKAFAARAELAVVVGISYFQTHDCRRKCSPVRRRDLRACGAIPLHPRPRRSAVPSWVVCNQNEIPSFGILRPPYPVHPVIPTRKYECANALRTTVSYDKAFTARAKLVVDVSTGCFRARDRWRACSPGFGRDSRTYGTILLLPCPCRSAASLWVGGIQEAGPYVGARGPQLGSLSRRYASLGAPYEKAFVTRAELLVDLGVGYFRARDFGGPRALQGKEEIRDRTAPCRTFLVPAARLRRYGRRYTS